MGKQLQNPFEIQLIFTIENGNIELEPSAHYGMSCEYGELGRKGRELTHTPQQEQAIKDFAKNVWYPQIKEGEGID